MEHRVDQVKCNSREFVSYLESFESRCAMGGTHVVQAGEWQFWVHLVLGGSIRIS